MRLPLPRAGRQGQQQEELGQQGGCSSREAVTNACFGGDRGVAALPAQRQARSGPRQSLGWWSGPLLDCQAASRQPRKAAGRLSSHATQPHLVVPS